MADTGTTSGIVPLNYTEIETAWHLFTILIQQGSPARLTELALRSALGPVLVEISSRLLGSPLKFTFGGFISSSDLAITAFGEFVRRAATWYVPRDAFWVSDLTRGSLKVSFTYVRKRKAPSLGNAAVLFSSSKRRTLLTDGRGLCVHTERSGEVKPMKVEGLPKLLSHFNEIPGKENFDFANPSGNYQDSVGMNSFDCSAAGLDQTCNSPMSLDSLSCFELRNFSYTKEEGARASDPYITNSVAPQKKVIDFLDDNISLDVELDANIIKEHPFRRFTALEPDFRPLSNQSSPANQTLRKDCKTVSFEFGFIAGIPAELNAPVDQVLDQNPQTQSVSSPLACNNQIVVEAINEIKLHPMDEKIINCQLEINETPASKSAYFQGKEMSMLTFELGDCDGNSAVIAEDKRRTFNEPSIKDQVASVGKQNLIGPNIASNCMSSTNQKNSTFEVGLIVKQKLKNVCSANMPSKENRVYAFTKVTKNSSDQKLSPNFESFIIQEEEGSGGYGTVYKAQRKEDGKIFAVKCPHANAHSHHIYNELKMLERFGGRNFVIKFECSFKNGDSECFVLEHVEHDRPEILKKEIGMFELQWYGFCMFKALASLHKQGVVHRDVKPGNFLFSRKVNKGYLIDFNLASDLNQKFWRSSERKMPSASVNPKSLPESKSTPVTLSRKPMNRGILENPKKATANESNNVLTSKSSNKKDHKGDTGGFSIFDRNKHGSQIADGSGVTSTKDQTSTKTPVDWLKQPIPSKGRKELINFVHKAMHSPQNLKPVSNGPSSQRKRVAAPMTKTDTRLVILTPMPLHSGGNAVPGAGMLKSKASGKVKREGPCVGTKGFRAPEVLFKSFYQGCKIDIWSAGVTLLYLMLGRAPFGGDPEQNIKEIAKLRGSEDLWEVAKLHNCESSFPVDLLEVGSLKSMKLSDWCAKNTRRPEFLELIPESLFDLVDKCLTVNPRCRFSAEEALMHKFFAPCHESIRKLRLLRKVATSDPSSSGSN
ncbi:serine/threonine-protein kinase ppk18 [Phalaenopsis equestris]|uniref:serine/threonine-protein kinase ppk18 n=1 Tax=Phalaenopsis equestris TaxID=78828 RepID=UPI0009E31725|nr:serine/threonine-protein kinase ppk18 [Phalaenopsis equestris]